MNPAFQSTMGISPVDRHAEIRHITEQIESLANHLNSRNIIWVKGRVLFDSPDSLFFDSEQISDLVDENSIRLYLGKIEETHYFAYQINEIPESQSEASLTDLRTLSLIADEEELGLLFHSQGLFNWHRHHKFCASCGEKTELSNAGHSRKCVSDTCKKDHFPRIDPAVIFSISDESREQPRLLLARQSNWDEGRYSVIAGFVEPGESLENAVYREAYEEVGLKLKSTKYIASQPWPFPSSMMVGFESVTNTTEISLIDKEIEHAMWLTADEIKEKLKSGSLKLPYSISISWFLIDRWFKKQTGESLKIIANKLQTIG